MFYLVVESFLPIVELQFQVKSIDLR